MAEIQVQSDFVVNGAVVLNKNETDFPANPRIGTLVVKDKILYGYLEIGGLQTWYPFSAKSNSYIHSQGGANVTWTVRHNLSTTNLFIQIHDASGNIINAAKQDIDNNSFRLLFTEAIIGTVLVVAPDSIHVPFVKTTLLEVGPNVTIDTSGVRINGAYALTGASIASDIAAAVSSNVTYANVQNKPTTVAGYGITDVYTKIAVDSAIAGVTSNVSTLSTQSGNFQNDIDAINQTLAGLATVATSGEYADLANVPSLAAVATAGTFASLTSKPTTITGYGITDAYTMAQANSYVSSAINAVVNGAPGTLDTLNEIAAALGNDANLSATLATQIATKANTASLAAVATAGTFASLTSKPTTVSGYGITDAYTMAQANVALGLKANTSSLATVATSGSYNDLTNKPTVASSVVFANVTSKPTTLSGYGITDAYTMAQANVALGLKANAASLATVASTGAYNDLTGKPTLFSGSYTDLSNKPTLFSGSYADLSGKPTLATVATSGDYGDLTGKPTLFSGSYADLTNKPNLATLAGSNSQDFSTANLSVNGDILPAVAGVSNIGSPTKKFNSIYTKEMRIDANTLYVDGVPVLGSSANNITFTANVNQGMRIATTGTGSLVLESNAATTIQSTGQNADVIIQSSGQGGQTRVTSATQVILTSPTVAVVGDQTVSGNMIVSGEFTVRGNVTTIESTVTTVKDNIITVNKGQQGSGVSLNVAGIDIDRGDLARQRLLWNEALGKWVVGPTTQEVALATEAFVASSITGKANTSSLATVATSGSYVDLSNKPTLFSGSYTDLTNKPALFSGAYADLSGKPTLATVASSGDYGDLLNKPSLSAVATTGTFASLTSKPTTISGYGILDAYTMAQANVNLGLKANTATTLAGYGITDAYTMAQANVNLGLKANTSSLATVATSGSYADLSNKPTIPTAVSSLTNDAGYQTAANVTSAISGKANTATTLAGYGILDSYTMAQANVHLGLKANTATTLAGYGITDAYTKTVVDTALGLKANTASLAAVATAGTFASLTSKPTTISGYGITDAYTMAQANSYVTTAISAVVNGAPGALDTLSEIAAALGNDANLSATLTTLIASKANTSSLAAVATAGTFASLTSKPTTISGYGITDAYTMAQANVNLGLKANTATTLAGYGITDAYTMAQANVNLGLKANTSALAAVATTGTFASLTSIPTTIAGYGITDAYTMAQANVNLGLKANTATTLSGYGITDAYTMAQANVALGLKANTSSLATVATSGSYADLTNKPTLFSGVFADLTSKPTTLSGYAITDAYTMAQANVALGLKANTATTLAGYGILDSYTMAQANVHLGLKANTSSLAAIATSGSFTDLTSKPTTLSGHGITDAYTMAQANTYVTSAISAVVNGAPGALDTLNEIAAALGNDANLSATLTTLIATKANTASLAAVATTGTFASLTSKPTTISGYGITDAYTMAQANVNLGFKANTATTLAGYGITDAYTMAQANVQIALKANVAAETTVNAATDAATASTLVRRDATGSFSGNVITATNFNTTSDARFKTDIVTIQDAVGLVEQLRGVSFNWVDTGAPTIGLIAQEVEEVLPELVSTDEDGYKSVAYSNMVGVLIEAIKDQQAQIDELREMVLNLSK